MLDNLKILMHQGKQYIPDVTTAKVPGIFRGRPIISSEKINENELMEICPTNAISSNPVAIDLGKCTFCGECAIAFSNKIKFTADYKIATNERNNLIVKEGNDSLIELNAELIRKEISEYFSGSLKLRQVSAGGDNSCELELNACSNVNFDMGRFGIEFVASPRHADGIVITGPITENMAQPLQICYDAIPEPKIIILAGTDAISGGIFEGSKALNRSFLNKYKIDLYVPGNPIHPLTFINGVLDLIKKRKKK
ncbi:formate hydrogenlyase subunit 7 [mine drainage metagenome]|uniref:Formate hydrogenlyase subunit 7 n=1 Tax=mine drainage metagenome TaxID=410659 RepID=A0A1J5R444_9ZZZZ